MRNILAALLIALSTSAFAGKADLQPSDDVVAPATEAAPITSSIVHLGGIKNYGGEDEKDFFNCTGFYIGGGLIVTAGHCLVPLAKYERQVVRFNNTEKFVAVIAALSNPDIGMADFGLLRLIDDNATDPSQYIPEPAAPIAKLDCTGTPLSTGDAVTARGYPYDYSGGGKAEITTWGKVAAGKYVSDPPFWAVPLIRHQLPLDPGSSGGALYADKSGEIVGITIAVTPGNHSLTYSQPITVVCKYLGLPAEENVDATKVQKP